MQNFWEFYFENEEADLGLTRSGRYKIKPAARPATGVDPASYADLGIDPAHLSNLRGTPDIQRTMPTFRERLSLIQQKEQSRGVPFIAWVLYAIRDLEKSDMPFAILYNYLKMGKISEEILEKALSQVAKTGLGHLTVDEFEKILPLIHWTPPLDQHHLKQLPSNNGMITTDVLRNLRRNR